MLEILLKNRKQLSGIAFAQRLKTLSLSELQVLCW